MPGRPTLGLKRDPTRKKTRVAEVPRQPVSHSALLDSAMLEKLVREAAYFRAERRGFIPGSELEDWLAAEQEVERFLVAGKVLPPGFADQTSPSR